MAPPAATPLLSLQDVRTWFPIRHGIFSRTAGYVRAVDGVDMDLLPGETLGLVGESGCGKSTLARTILRLEPARSGTIRFEGVDLARLEGKALRRMRRKLQVVFQDPFASLNPRMTVVDLLTEGLCEHRLIKPRQKAETARGLLRDVGMDPDALHRYPHEFSGGQRQRICIARALSLRPRLILCDEAVSALDVSVRAQVLNLLADLREKYGLAYLFISHDLSVVRHVSDRIAVMYVGRIIEQGPAEEIIAAPRHPYTRALIAAVPRMDREHRPRLLLRGEVPSPAAPPPGCRFHPRCPFAREDCRRTEPALEAPADEPDARRLVACLRKDDPELARVGQRQP